MFKNKKQYVVILRPISFFRYHIGYMISKKFGQKLYPIFPIIFTKSESSYQLEKFATLFYSFINNKNNNNEGLSNNLISWRFSKFS